MKYLKYFEAKHPTEFWGNKGAGILPYCIKSKRFLISHRSDFVYEPNTFGVWGGKFDSDILETPQTVAQREFLEETGYRGNIKLIPAYIYTSPNNDFTYYNFIGLLDHEFEPELDWETQGFKWITIEELYNMKNLHFGLELLLNKSKNLIYRINKDLFQYEKH